VQARSMMVMGALVGGGLECLSVTLWWGYEAASGVSGAYVESVESCLRAVWGPRRVRTRHKGVPRVILGTVDAALVGARVCLRSLPSENPYAAPPPLRAHLHYADFAPGHASSLVRQEIRASVVGDGDGCAGSRAGAGGRRLDRLSVMLVGGGTKSWSRGNTNCHQDSHGRV